MRAFTAACRAGRRVGRLRIAAGGPRGRESDVGNNCVWTTVVSPVRLGGSLQRPTLSQETWLGREVSLQYASSGRQRGAECSRAVYILTAARAVPLTRGRMTVTYPVWCGVFSQRRQQRDMAAACYPLAVNTCGLRPTPLLLATRRPLLISAARLASHGAARQQHPRFRYVGHRRSPGRQRALYTETRAIHPLLRVAATHNDTISPACRLLATANSGAVCMFTLTEWAGGWWDVAGRRGGLGGGAWL